MLAARESAFAAIVCISRRNTFPFFAAFRGFRGELSAAKAVERLEKQEHCDDADRNVDSPPHALLSRYQIMELRNYVLRYLMGSPDDSIDHMCWFSVKWSAGTLR